MREDDFQQVAVQWFTLQHPKFAPLLHHSPNGGKRSKAEAGRFKAMGTRAGFPDLTLLIARGGYHGLFIELKVGKNKQTELQQEFQHQVEVQGYRYELCYNLDQFINTINSYLNEK